MERSLLLQNTLATSAKCGCGLANAGVEFSIKGVNVGDGRAKVWKLINHAQSCPVDGDGWRSWRTLRKEQALAKELHRDWSSVSLWATIAASSAYRSSRMRTRLTLVLARRRERLKSFPELRVWSRIPEGSGKARWRRAEKKIPNRVGASTHPCLTPQWVWNFSDLEPLNWTVACMSSWNPMRMDKSVSGHPRHFKMENRPERLTESKAFVKSIKTT